MCSTAAKPVPGQRRSQKSGTRGSSPLSTSDSLLHWGRFQALLGPCCSQRPGGMNLMLESNQCFPPAVMG
jgi:hypothetical protein